VALRFELPAHKKLVHQSTVQLRWGDMDAMGHINNTLYFRYMEVARLEWIFSTGASTDLNGRLIVEVEEVIDDEPVDGRTRNLEREYRAVVEEILELRGDDGRVSQFLRSVVEPGTLADTSGYSPDLTFDQKVDRIVSIGAFEHFGRDKYAAFFEKCRSLLPDDGVMLLHTITYGKPSKAFGFLRFVHFMSVKIFPGGDVPFPERVVEAARNANFEVAHVESLRLHYARTLDCWAQNLEAARDQAVAVAGEQTYRTYMKYLTSCADYFRSGECNVHQFKLRVA